MIPQNPQGKNLLSDQREPISKSQINFHINSEDENINRITIVSKDDEEITLFPMTLESGEEYMPNLNGYIWGIEYDESRWSEVLEKDNGTSSIFTLKLKEIEYGMTFGIEPHPSHLSFLEFTRDNLSPEEYARFVIEQRAVQEALFVSDSKGEIKDEVFKKDYNALVMYWPEYYPKIKNYDSEFLPTTEGLYPAFLFNKLAYILSHREEDDNLEVNRFDIRELLYLETFIQNNPINNASEIFEKIRKYNNIDSNRISDMLSYIQIWKYLEMMEYHRLSCFEDLKNISRWKR